MKKLLCIDANDSDLIEDEIYHLEDVVECDVCGLVAYVLFESEPFKNSSGEWLCVRCKNTFRNPSNKTAYNPDRFVELDSLDISELVAIAKNEDVLVNSRFSIHLSPAISTYKKFSIISRLE